MENDKNKKAKELRKLIQDWKGRITIYKNVMSEKFTKYIIDFEFSYHEDNDSMIENISDELFKDVSVFMSKAIVFNYLIHSSLDESVCDNWVQGVVEERKDLIKKGNFKLSYSIKEETSK